MMTPLREDIPLRYRKIIKKSVGQFVRILVLATIATVAFFFIYDTIAAGKSHAAQVLLEREDSVLAFWMLCMGLWVLWAPFYQYLYFLSYYYDMDDKNVVIRKGVLVKKEIILPFSKITDVYVDQDAADVVLALYDVHISTPTVSSGEFAHIDGVDRKGASKLRQLILDRINKEQAQA